MDDMFIEENKTAYLIGFVLVFSIFLLYLYTLCPSLPPGDGGELITAARCMGIAHNPGYPLYVITGKLFTYIPIGNIAWRLNLMSAFFSSLTLLMLYFFIFRSTGRIIPSVASVITLALSFSFWLFSIYAEVFSLNSFLIMSMFYLIFVWKNNVKVKYFNIQIRLLCIISFISGLSLTNQQTSLLVFPSLLFVVALTNFRAAIKPRNLFCIFTFFLLGLALYLYLPVASRSNPYIDWGNPENYTNFINCILRNDYGTLSLSKNLAVEKPSLQSIWAQTLLFFQMSFKFMGSPAILVAIPGLIWLYRNRMIQAVAITLALYFTGPFYIIVSGLIPNDENIAILTKFMCAPSVFWAVLAGFGVFSILRFVEKHQTSLLNKSPVKSALLASILIILTAFPLSANFSEIERNSNKIPEEYGLNIFRTLPENSILLATGDTTLFASYYLQYVEKMRPDVIIISTYQTQWKAEQTIERHPSLFGIESLQGNEFKQKIQEITGHYRSANDFIIDIIVKNINTHPIYFSNEEHYVLKLLLPYCVPHGVLLRILKTDATGEKLRYLNENRDIWKCYFLKDLDGIKESNYKLMHDYLEIYAGACNFAGTVYYSCEMFDDSIEEYKKALMICPGFPNALENMKLSINEKIKNSRKQNIE